jgi:hypothetical protein
MEKEISVEEIEQILKQAAEQIPVRPFEEVWKKVKDSVVAEK